VDIVVTSLNLAAIYALVALGLAVTWAGLKFLNLAHGATFALAGVGAVLTAEHVSSSPPVVLLAGIAVGGLAGVLIWLVIYLPLDGRGAWETRSLTASLGLSLIGTYALLNWFGPSPRALPPIFGHWSITLSGTVVTADRVGTIACAAVVLPLVVLALRKTRFGLAIRAVSQNPEGAQLAGINRTAVALTILAASGALAGLASVLLSQTFFVSWQSGYTPLLEGMIVAILGGLGSIPGTIVAALLMGATEALTATYLNQGDVLLVQFALIAVVLLVRPRGVAGMLEAARA
jgi:branched-chain amino acid transport system permease protein